MESRYMIGSMEFRTKAAAVAKAKEYIKYDGEPVTISIERWKTDKYTKTRGRVLGFSASSLLPTKYITVKVGKRKSNPSYPRVKRGVRKTAESRVSTALNKFMKCKAVRFNKNGSVSIKK